MPLVMKQVVYPDFLVRYSIIAPKIFADGGADNKGTANKALLHVGMDPDNFRTGHTKVILSLVFIEYVAKEPLISVVMDPECLRT